MEKLKLILGPAPSEMPWDELVQLCKRERDRTTQVLYSPPAPPKKAKSRTKKAKPRLTRGDVDELTALLDEALGKEE